MGNSIDPRQHLNMITQSITFAFFVLGSASAQLTAQDLLGLAELNGQSGIDYGCGPNPLLQLVRDMPHWLVQSIATARNNGDMFRGIRSDGAAYQEFHHLKRDLSRFRDCLKAGDGVKAKKAYESIYPKGLN